MYRTTIISTAIWLLCLPVGCTPNARIYPEKAPLPVVVMRLEKTTPQSTRLYPGSIRSWKVEDISFEVDGRVKWVVEPGTEIRGRAYKANGELLFPGTQIAQLDEERFLTALESAKSKVEIETLRHDGIRVRIDKSARAEIASAQAQYDLALTEYQRNERLVAQNAGARKDLDKAKASLDAAQSTLDGANATLLQTEAEAKSAEAATKQAMQAQKDAQRNLDDTNLYSAFRGQVAAIHVAPGSLAGKQSPVATIQMMNPIKVELQISAATSRRMELGRTLTLSLTTAVDRQETAEATVYAIAPSADNATRTFTLTLLVLNRKVELEIPESIDAGSIASTPNLWRVGLGILPPTDEGVYYMPENGLHSDDKGDYVWRVINFKADAPTQRVLKVGKLYVKTGDVSMPFLGKARFRTVEVLPKQDFDPANDLFASDLLVNGERSRDWVGDTMLLDQGSGWLLRPGDVVQVDLSRQIGKAGLYVPIEAIHETAGRTSVFVVDTSGDKSTVKEVEVSVVDDHGPQVKSILRVEPATENIDLEGRQIVVEGVHYLVDGQQVAVTRVTGEDQ